MELSTSILLRWWPRPALRIWWSAIVAQAPDSLALTCASAEPGDSGQPSFQEFPEARVAAEVAAEDAAVAMADAEASAAEAAAVLIPNRTSIVTMSRFRSTRATS